MKYKMLIIMLSIMVITFILFIFKPSKVSKSYSGINFDFNDEEVAVPVIVDINGTLTKDLMLRPKTFKGTISVDSNIFEFTEPVSFMPIPYGKSKKYYELYLDFENVSDWKLNHDSLYNRFGQRALWIIYTDKNFSVISIVPMPPDKDGGWTSSSEIITAPCDNREDAINITNKLRTEGYSME